MFFKDATFAYMFGGTLWLISLESMRFSHLNVQFLNLGENGGEEEEEEEEYKGI